MASNLIDTVALGGEPHSEWDSAAAMIMRVLLPGPTAVQALYTVADLRIADLVAVEPMPIARLAESTETDPAALGVVLRALISIGIFAERSDGCIGQNAISDLLRETHPASVRSRVLLFGSPMVSRSVANLPAAVRTGKSPFEQTFGQGFYEYLMSHPTEREVFHRGLPDRPAVAAELLECCDFSRFTHVVDVGGGNGSLLTDILTVHPHLRGTFFDISSTQISAALRRLADGPHKRCMIVEGDFFRSIPASGDVYILSHVLHNWNETRAAAILERCREAIAPGGTLLVLETVRNTARRTRFFMGLFLSVLTGWDERSASRIDRLLADAGFHIVARRQVGVTLTVEAARS